MKTITAILLLCSAAGAADMQFLDDHGHIALYGTQSDDPLPDFDPADTEETVVIPFGETVTLVRDETALDVLNYGTLNLAGHTLHVRTLTNHGSDEGMNDDGTVCECCSTQGRTLMTDGSKIVIRDLPFDPADIQQWGVGVLNLHGGQSRAATDDWRQAFATLAEDVDVGDTTIRLIGEPRGWRTGDTLVLPDTRQPATGDDISAQTEVVVIRDTHLGDVYTIDPVQFDHNGAHGRMPDVGCPFQPMTIRSENPAGMRGHFASVGHGSHYLTGVQFIGMGRTTTAPLGAENVIGRYAIHWHHSAGHPAANEPWQGELVHCSVWDSPKWGVSIHNSFFDLVEDCCFFDCQGAGIVTEQVHSYGFRVANNFVCAKTSGSGQRIVDRSSRNDSSATADHWHDRVGMGLGSAMGEITGNRLYCCKESIGMAGFGVASLFFPVKRGVMLTGIRDPNAMAFWAYSYDAEGIRLDKIYPLTFDTSGNRAWGGWRGIETWSANSAPDDQTIKVTTLAANTKNVPNDLTVKHFFPGYEILHCRNSTELMDQEETALYGWKILGDGQTSPPTGSGTDSTYAFDMKGAYRFGVTLQDCELAGHDAAYRLVDDGKYTRFIRCTFGCPVINYMDTGRKVQVGGAWEGTWEGCTFLGEPLFADGDYPKYDLSLWLQKNRKSYKALPPIRYFVRPWHDGRDYQVFHYEQLPDWQHAKGDPGTAYYGDLPPGVWTHQQLLALDPPMPIFGDVVPPEAVQWGKFWASDITPPPPTCAEELEAALQRIRELEMQLEGN